MQTVLITGASSGIGLATAVELAKRNWSVLATMRDLERRSDLDRQARAANVSEHVIVRQLDVTNSQSIDSLVASVNDGPLDAVVHNAGISAGGAFEDLDDALVRTIMEVNFFDVHSRGGCYRNFGRSDTGAS